MDGNAELVDELHDRLGAGWKSVRAVFSWTNRHGTRRF
jgi:hypothetical protein